MSDNDIINIQTVSLENNSMNYFSFGSGDKNFIILPGLSIQSVMDSARMIAEAYDLFTREFTAYVFDRANETEGDLTVHQMAEETARAIASLGLCDNYIFGASQGGMIALDLIAHHPGLVKKAVIGSSCAKTDNESFAVIENWINLAKAKAGADLFDEFGRNIYPPAFYEQNRQALRLLGDNISDDEFERFVIHALAVRDYDITDKLGEIKCPVLVLGSADDAVLSGGASAEIYRGLTSSPDSGIYMYDGFGHAAFDTAPDYKDRIFEFFIK